MTMFNGVVFLFTRQNCRARWWLPTSLLVLKSAYLVQRDIDALLHKGLD